MMNSDDAAVIKLGEMEFPVALLDALRERRLVVFAGAGVSMGEPACLPDFKGLAQEVAEGTGEVLNNGENPSLFLDRLLDRGVKVHERAAESIVRRSSMPTETHKNLLRLFEISAPVRIITTNFDLLFENAVESENLFESEIESYRAPALPLGSDFDGIVHVHGSVKRASDMVLTDTDFGKAYLTDGSARRFLSDAFANYTILFVGYSHNDTILNYLARALPPTDQKRFALIPDKSKAEHWNRLKIDRIDYRVRGNNHQALHTGIHALKEFVNRRPTEWRSEIERIVKKSATDLDDDHNLLQYALKEKMNAKFFTNAAETPDWLDWIDEQGYLNGLYDQNKWNDKSGLWIFWLTNKFAVSYADRLQYVIGRREGPLHYFLWDGLSNAVQSADLDENALSKWVALLLSRAPQQMMGSLNLLPLGQHCAKSGLMFEAAQIFDVMLKNQLFIKRYDFPAIDPDSEYHNTPDMEQVYSHPFAAQLWTNALKPKINQFADLLISSLIRRLEDRHFKLKGWGITSRYSDLSQGSMELIESLAPSNQIHGSHTLALCAAQDCLDWLIKNRREEGVYWQRRLATSESPLLRALAAHSVRMDAGLSSDEKAAWLLKINPLLEVERLNDSAPYRELYRLAEEIYPELDDERRGSLIEAVAEYRFSRPDREPDVELDEQHRYDWYHILHRSDPECPLAKAAFEEAQSKRPEWRPRSDFGIQIIHGSPSSLTPEQLLARQGSEWASELPVLFIQVSEEPRINDSVEGLLKAVRDAAKQDFDWGMDLADGLADANEWKTDVWLGLLQAWAHGENTLETDLDKDQFKKVLNRIDNENLHRKQRHDYFIISTLDSLVVNGGAPYAFELLSETNRIAASLWDKIDKQDAERPMPAPFLDNRSAACLTRYWLNGLQLLHKDSDSAPEGLEQDCTKALSKIAQDPSPKGRVGRLALAQRFTYLLHVKKEWTKDNLLPLFSNDKEFQSVWEGFLTIQYPGNERNFTKETAKILYRPSYKAIKRFLPDNKLSECFVNHYTEMVMFTVKKPIQRWIPEFFKRSSKENRHSFMDRLGWYLLRYMDDEAKLCGLWEHWLKSYWKNRLQGVPRPLDEKEIGIMLVWSYRLGPKFPEAVKLAVQMEPTSAQEAVDARFLYHFSGTDLPSTYPEATARLLLYLSNLPLSPGTSMDLRNKGPELIDNLPTLNFSDDLKRDLEDLRTTLS